MWNSLRSFNPQFERKIWFSLMRGEKTEQMRELMRNDNRLNLHFLSSLTSFQQWHHRFIRLITDVRTSGDKHGTLITTLFTLFSNWQRVTRTFLLERNGWTDMKALENRVYSEWSPAALCEHTAQKSHFLFTCTLLAFRRRSVWGGWASDNIWCLHLSVFQLSEEGNELVLLLPLI